MRSSIIDMVKYLDKIVYEKKRKYYLFILLENDVLHQFNFMLRKDILLFPFLPEPMRLLIFYTMFPKNYKIS